MHVQNINQHHDPSSTSPSKYECPIILCPRIMTDKLPNPEMLVVEQAKVVDYLLNPLNSRGKAAFFLKLGFTSADWQGFADRLKQHGRENPVTTVAESPYGIRYSVEGPLNSPDRWPYPTIRTIWIVEAGSTTPRLITAHPA